MIRFSQNDLYSHTQIISTCRLNITPCGKIKVLQSALMSFVWKLFQDKNIQVLLLVEDLIFRFISTVDKYEGENMFLLCY